MIKIYLTDVTPLENTELYGRVYNSLPVWRRRAADACGNVADKYLSVGAGFLLATALKLFNIDILTADFSTNEYGKPYISDHKEIDFSLSHSGSFAMCAVSDRRIGCDIQCVTYARPAVARRFFTVAEYEYIITSADPQSEFIRLWTLKESYVKALGLGIHACPLNSFELIPSNGSVPVLNRHTFFEYVPSACCRAAVCIADDCNEPPELITLSPGI